MQFRRSKGKIERKEIAKRLKPISLEELRERTRNKQHEEIIKDIQLELSMIRINQHNPEIMQRSLDRIKAAIEKISKDSKSNKDIATALHGLKNPIQMISGSLELAKVTNNSKKLERILPAVEIAEEKLERFENPLNPMLIEKFNFLRLLHKIEGIKMDVKVKPIKGGYVLADAGRFSETVETLVKNAKEAGAKQVKITGRPLKNSYQIVVENKGAIPEDVLEKLRRFERGFTTKSTGSGIGLPGAKHTTETHGGRIFIESSKGRFGKGKTRVIILLPVKKKSSKTNK